MSSIKMENLVLNIGDGNVVVWIKQGYIIQKVCNLIHIYIRSVGSRWYCIH